jgi:hypothetical protein
MSYTRLQLANRALVKMGVVGTGQSPEAEDTDKVDDIIDAVSAHLEAAQIYSIPDIDAIEDSAFEWVADFLAYTASPDFSLPVDEAKRLRAERMLKLITSSGPSRQPMTVDYF